MKVRQISLTSKVFDHMSYILPIIGESGSDSSMLDNAIEFFYLNGATLD